MFQIFSSMTPRWWVLWFIFLCSGCTGFSSQSTPFVPSSQALPSHMLIIDAGSSGSRIYIYKTDWGLYENLPHITLKGSKKVTPGISQFEEDPALSLKNLKVLLNAAKDHIPVSQWQKTPLYLYATAGMRLLSSDKRERILIQIDGFFRSDNSFNFKRPEVIAGSYEGLYSWLAVNFLDDGFDPETEREGMLEMGGASAQIAYSTSKWWSSNLMKRTIRGKKYAIYSKSYLYVGENASREFTAAQGCFPKGLSMGERIIKEKGDFEKCSDGVLENFNGLCENLEENGPHCIFKNTPPKVPPGKYFALSAYYYLFDFFYKNDGKGALSIYQKGGLKFCGETWEGIKKKYSGENESYLKNYCFSSAYFSLLLSRGFKLKDNVHLLTPIDKIKDTEVSWTLGAVIDLMMGYEPDTYGEKLD